MTSVRPELAGYVRVEEGANEGGGSSDAGATEK